MRRPAVDMEVDLWILMTKGTEYILSLPGDVILAWYFGR
jgi:hypothetical protein